MEWPSDQGHHEVRGDNVRQQGKKYAYLPYRHAWWWVKFLVFQIVSTLIKVDTLDSTIA